MNPNPDFVNNPATRDRRRAHSARRRAGVVAGLPAAVLVATLAGCGLPAGSVSAGPATPQAPPQAPDPPLSLVGIWQTASVPVEELKANYVAAGGSEQSADGFVASLHTAQAVRFRVVLTERGWAEYELTDGAHVMPGWSGTYTVEGSTVHSVDEEGACRIDYAVDFDGYTMAFRVLSDQGERRDCGASDLQAAQAIYESAPFTRVADPGRMQNGVSPRR